MVSLRSLFLSVSFFEIVVSFGRLNDAWKLCECLGEVSDYLLRCV